MFDAQQIANLKRSVEEMVNYKMVTPKDFDLLSEQIFSRLNILLSPTTLKRIWGYLNENSTPRISTLSILAQFVGYRDWSAFTADYGKQLASQSNLILSRKLSAYALNPGDKVVLTWLPNRYCKIKHIHECTFEVIEAKNTKLQVGDTFQCSIFIEGEPLYIDNLTHEPYSGIAYVAGKKDGIRFELEPQA